MPYITWCRSMKIRVGYIPYLNSAAFYYRMVADDVELCPLVPSALSRAAHRGEVDVGPVPLVDCFRLEEHFVPLGDFCISTLDKSRSILFFSQRPIEELSGARVGITGETSTSSRLLQVLLTRRFQVQPVNYVSSQDSNDAFLLIGDSALKSRLGVPSYPYKYDLGEEWHRWTGLPFVYALWIVRRDLEPETVDYLVRLVGDSLKQGLANLEGIARGREDLGMSYREIREYLEGFRYVLGEEERKAMELFRNLYGVTQTLEEISHAG